jgi:hypothetical protein
MATTHLILGEVGKIFAIEMGGENDAT